jgi:RND family efflux transporter MFP subunit
MNQSPNDLPERSARPATMKLPRRSTALLVAFATAVCLLAACGRRTDGSAAAASAPASATSGASPAGPAASAAPVSVSTVQAQQRDVPVRVTATGAVAPLSSVEVRPQSTSLIKQVHIREGQFVRRGDLLFTLDARVDEANLAKARAQLTRDEAALADARRQLARSRDLLAQNFVSQGAVDTNQAGVDTQLATLASDRAAIDAAQVAVSYARIKAPGAGRAGAIVVYPGSAVQANQTTLVTITQLDPIAVAFSLPQRHLDDALAALKGHGAAVSATLPGGGAALNGRLSFVDNAVDPASGTVKVKAEFANRDGRLWPGAFVNVALTVSVLKAAVVIPQAAVVQNARGTLVYAVQGGRAVARPVQVQFAQGDDAAVSGLRAGERIVLDGRQNLRPGAAVVERAGEADGAASRPAKP